MATLLTCPPTISLAVQAVGSLKAVGAGAAGVQLKTGRSVGAIIWGAPPLSSYKLAFTAEMHAQSAPPCKPKRLGLSAYLSPGVVPLVTPRLLECTCSHPSVSQQENKLMRVKHVACSTPCDRRGFCDYCSHPARMKCTKGSGAVLCL